MRTPLLGPAVAQGLSRWGRRIKAAFPALAFFSGFLWDAVTLGRSITSLDLFLLLGYLVSAAGLLMWMGRRRSPDLSVSEQTAGVDLSQDAAPAPSSHPWLRILLKEGPDLALQFFFGGLFSALVIFYFLSSSYLPSFALVLGLAALLGANEFFEGYSRRFTLSWTLFATCAILFLNFALPHLFRSASPLWFYLSTALGYGSVVLLKRVSPRATGSLKPAAGVALGLTGLYLLNAIPPVPLVKKDLLICRDLVRKDGRYTARIEAPPLYAPWRNTDRHVRQRPGEKVYCYTSVFLPPGIATTLYHVWQHRDPRTGRWFTGSRIGFPVRGGRAEGYRGYTFKRKLDPGQWQVRVETSDGRILGINRFRVAAAAPGETPDFVDLALH